MIQKSGIKALAIKQAASKSNKKDRRLNRSIRNSFLVNDCNFLIISTTSITLFVSVFNVIQEGFARKKELSLFHYFQCLTVTCPKDTDPVRETVVLDNSRSPRLS